MAFTGSHNFDIRVYAENTDMMGIVYHSNFLNFFERARTEMIRETGLSLSARAAYDCHFAIASADLHYFYPARVDDLLKVATRIVSKKACSVLFDQSIHNQDNILLCEAQIKVVCIDNKMKPRRLPEDIF
ncbi:MAG: YbgC/FadM family acyl-CoA thioesterase [Tatlockia sp.]|nr:YbgC/FadM family acyl-CoA thioesterase [Tatlockia sp.]